MARRGENIYRRKDGRWEGRYSYGFDLSGRLKYHSVYARTYQEVKSKLEKKKNLSIIYSSSGTTTVKELFEEWLSAVKLRVKPSTFACYRMKADKHILPEFGSIFYKNLNIKDIQKFIDSKINSGLSSKYVSDIIIEFKSMTKYTAKVHNFINPLENVKLPKTTNRQMRLLSETDQKKLCEYATVNTDKTKLGVLLSYYTGIRIGELCGLKWSDIDLEMKVLNVKRTVQRIANVNEGNSTQLFIGEPKSRRSQRAIPIPEFLSDILIKHKTSRDTFILSGTEKLIEPRTMQYRFKSLLKKANLPSINFHSLRHMFATNCIKLGFDVKTLSEILGHSCVEITLPPNNTPPYPNKSK